MQADLCARDQDAKALRNDLRCCKLVTYMPETSGLITPYGGTLTNLLIPSEERKELFSYAATLRSIQLTPRQTFDLELLSNGGFSPIDRFMSEADYLSVMWSMRLANGTFFPLPVTLSVDDIGGVETGSDVTLRDSHNDVLAVMSVEEIYEWNASVEAAETLGTTDLKHPYAAELSRLGRFNISGRLRVFSLPKHFDNNDLRMTPTETRGLLAGLGRDRVVAFQTRNPVHRAHEALMQKAIEITDATLLLHPVVGPTKDGDIDHFTRVRVYREVVEKAFPAGRAALSLLPLAMRMAGPREALLHAIIRRNYGASHFILGRDHASPGVDSVGIPFYQPEAARELAKVHADEIGVSFVPFDEFVYTPGDDRYVEASKVNAGEETLSLSGTQIREDYVNRGKTLPSWFTRPEVAAIIAESYPPKNRQGLCIWFTGLSGSGKSTTAEILAALLMAKGRLSTILDGDVVRTNLSKGLGFSREDRDTNIRRIGFVASVIAKHGGISICAAVSPYRRTRDEVREMFGPGQFVEVFVDTPLAICESRDAKGMYAKARRGEIKDFTGIDDVYEEPASAEITLDTVANSAELNASEIIGYLERAGFIK